MAADVESTTSILEKVDNIFGVCKKNESKNVNYVEICLDVVVLLWKFALMGLLVPLIALVHWRGFVGIFHYFCNESNP